MDDEYPDADERETNVYGDKAREDMVSNDEIDPEEEAFMQGYEEADDEDKDEDDEDYEESFDD